MNFYDALLKAIDKEGLTQAAVLAAAGRSATFISNARSRGSVPQVDTAAKLLNAANHQLFVVPKGTKLPKDSYELTFETSKEEGEKLAAKAKKLEEQARKLREQIKE